MGSKHIILSRKPQKKICIPGQTLRSAMSIDECLLCKRSSDIRDQPHDRDSLGVRVKVTLDDGDGDGREIRGKA